MPDGEFVTHLWMAFFPLSYRIQLVASSDKTHLHEGAGLGRGKLSHPCQGLYRNICDYFVMFSAIQLNNVHDCVWSPTGTGGCFMQI